LGEGRKAYAFDGPGGKETLADLFGGRSQLIVYHFMLGPGWKEGCPSCSFISDHIDGSVVHLAARDVRLVVVSRAPLAEIEASRSAWAGDSIGCRRIRPTSITTTRYQWRRMSWRKARSITTTACRNSRARTARHERVLQGCSRQHLPHLFELLSRAGHAHRAYNWLDLTPKGRDEEGLKHGMAWVRHHDKYDEGHQVDTKAGYVQPAKA